MTRHTGMKLHKNLVSAVALTLQEIFLRDRHADKAIEKLFKNNPQWGSRDRRFVAEAIYDIVRNYRLYATLADSERNFWFIFAVWLALRNEEVPGWQEFRDFDAARVERAKERISSDPRVKYSYPDWMWENCQAELGEEKWSRIAAVLHEQAPVWLRANTLKTDPAKLVTQLQADGVPCTPLEQSDAIRLEGRPNVFRHRLFSEGWFEVQDAGSQRISSFLDPKPGETVIDACAGAGGKSLHISALMKNRGRVISLDVDDRKLEELRKRARRAGSHNLEARHISGDDVIRKLSGIADRVLLDVPCSGLGVLKRNPDTKWKLKRESIEETRQLQHRILGAYAHMARPGGEVVYSTCSILPSENRAQVDAFLAGQPAFSLISDLTIDPSEDTDGFYMAKLRRS